MFEWNMEQARWIIHRRNESPQKQGAVRRMNVDHVIGHVV